MSRKRRKSPQLKAMQQQWNATRPLPIAPRPQGSRKNGGNQKKD
jgi:hypothetical protein